MRALPLCLAFLVLSCVAHVTPSTAPLDGGGLSPLGGPCVQALDCVGPEMLCGFAIADTCNAQGVCVAEQFSCQGDGTVACACSGGAVELGCLWGPGFAPVPVVSATPGCDTLLDAGFD